MQFDLVKIDNSDVMKVKKLGADVCMVPVETTTQPPTTGKEIPLVLWVQFIGLSFERPYLMTRVNLCDFFCL